MTEPRSKPRWFPTWKGALLIALPWFALTWVRWTDPLGDRGSVNVFSYLLIILSVVFYLLWFLIASGRPWTTRLGVTVLPVLGVVVFLNVFRIERMSGEMIPTFALRSTPKSDRVLSAPSRENGPLVDLKTATPDDFPGFLGPDGRQAIDHVRLDPDWSARPPEELWRRELGSGWSGFAVRNGIAVTMEQRGEQEMVTCYSVADGEPCWVWAYPTRYESTIAGDGPRATPAIADGVVYSLGVHGKLAALDGADGTPIWQRDLDDELGLTEERSTVLPYGRSNSPLVVGERLIVPYGGTPERGFVSLLAVDRHSGETLWQGGDHQISCASPVVAVLAGERQIVSVDAERVAGYDLSTGAVLWSRPWPGRTEADCNVSQPVPVDGSRVFLSKGYGQGAALVEVSRNGDAFEVAELWHQPRTLRTKFTNVSLHEGYVYGLSDGILECAELETGARQWKKGRYRHGQILRVSDHLLVLSEQGEVFLVDADPKNADSVRGSFQGLDGKTWNNPALYGDVLLIRNGHEAAAYRLPLAPSTP